MTVDITAIVMLLIVLNVLVGIVIMSKEGLYANIAAKRKRIAGGSGEKMRDKGSKGAPTNKAFRQSAKTAKKRKRS